MDGSLLRKDPERHVVARDQLCLVGEEHLSGVGGAQSLPHLAGAGVQDIRQDLVRRHRVPRLPPVEQQAAGGGENVVQAVLPKDERSRFLLRF